MPEWLHTPLFEPCEIHDCNGLKFGIWTKHDEATNKLNIRCSTAVHMSQGQPRARSVIELRVDGLLKAYKVVQDVELIEFRPKERIVACY